MPTNENAKEDQLPFAFGKIGDYPRFPVIKTQVKWKVNDSHDIYATNGSNRTLLMKSQSHFRWLSGFLQDYRPESNQSFLNWEKNEEGHDIERNPWKDFSRFIFELGLYHTMFDENQEQ